jgi:hypothetical protein
MWWMKTTVALMLESESGWWGGKKWSPVGRE